MATNVDAESWVPCLGDEPLAMAMLDRVVHGATIVTLKVRLYRVPRAGDEVTDLPISKPAADEAHLHLWTTNAFLFETERVTKTRSFTYKCCLIWNKPQIGNGNYWRVKHEFLLLGVRPFAAT